MACIGCQQQQHSRAGAAGPGVARAPSRGRETPATASAAHEAARAQLDAGPHGYSERSYTSQLVYEPVMNPDGTPTYPEGLTYGPDSISAQPDSSSSGDGSASNPITFPALVVTACESPLCQSLQRLARAFGVGQ